MYIKIYKQHLFIKIIFFDILLMFGGIFIFRYLGILYFNKYLYSLSVGIFCWICYAVYRLYFFINYVQHKYYRILKYKKNNYSISHETK